MKSGTLLIDTSTRYQIFARVESGADSVLIKSAAESGEDTIDTAVAELFPDLNAIGEIWLGEGPGSFVGLRSSFAYVRMLTMLRSLPCRTFHSSRLWHQLLGVPAGDWLLLRTNARMYYAERFSPEREARALDLMQARELTGIISCYNDSWKAKNENAPESDLPEHWHMAQFNTDQIETGKIDAGLLQLSEPKLHNILQPLYGHELHFKLAKGNNG